MNLCLHCKHEWEGKPIGNIPKRCPKCKSYTWQNLPKVIPNPLYINQAVENKSKEDKW